MAPWPMPIKNPTKYHIFLASKFLFKKENQNHVEQLIFNIKNRLETIQKAPILLKSFMMVYVKISRACIPPTQPRNPD